jgi:hypothetical protein
LNIYGLFAAVNRCDRSVCPIGDLQAAFNRPWNCAAFYFLFFAFVSAILKYSATPSLTILPVSFSGKMGQIALQGD